MGRKVFSLILFLTVLCPLVASAQFFEKQKVVVWEIFDRNNDVKVSSAAKQMIRTGFVDAFVSSRNYEAFEANIDDVKNYIKSNGWSVSPLNIAVAIRNMYKVDYVLFTTLKVLQHGTSYDTFNMLLTSELVSTETQKTERTSYQELKSDINEIPVACATLLGKLLGEQIGVASSAVSSNQAVDGGTLDELYSKAKGFYKNKVYGEAFRLFKQLAVEGHVYSQNCLGECYYYGIGVSQSYSDAVYWYRKAADQGNDYAQYNLGWCYENGQGVSQSYSDAVYWYRKAADQGHDDAQCSLGSCYYSGLGVSQSFSDAVYWYRKAADQGDDVAQCSLGWCYEKGLGVSQSYSDARYWYQKAADQGNETAKEKLQGM